MEWEEISKQTAGMSAVAKREFGKAWLFGREQTEEQKRCGLRLIFEAHVQKDPEATFIIGKLMLDGVLTAKEDCKQHALTMICTAANRGSPQARAFLNSYCTKRYGNAYGERNDGVSADGGLVGFDGRPIRISRKGVFTPVDAVLERKDGKNILTLSANIVILWDDDLGDGQAFKDAVFKGLMAWQGEYTVFGGQQLSVRVVLTEKSNLFDNVVIFPVSERNAEDIQAMVRKISPKKGDAQARRLFSGHRSFAMLGSRWSVTSRKIIAVQSQHSFRDYDEIMHVVKHEFGHALGLGDLYESETDDLVGVETGSYGELDCYAITDKFYNLVMCDHHGPISNNDIEMVVLAFKDNKMQLFQPEKCKGVLSSALGRGN